VADVPASEDAAAVGDEVFFERFEHTSAGTVEAARTLSSRVTR
jgi:hypothetical protein